MAAPGIKHAVDADATPQLIAFDYVGQIRHLCRQAVAVHLVQVSHRVVQLVAIQQAQAGGGRIVALHAAMDQGRGFVPALEEQRTLEAGAAGQVVHDRVAVRVAEDEEGVKVALRHQLV